MTITAIHRHGDGACCRVAFFYDDDGAPQDRIEAHRVLLPDGSRPNEGEAMECGSCGAPLGVSDIDLLPGEWDARVR